MPVEAIGFDALPGLAGLSTAYALFADGSGKGVWAPGLKRLYDSGVLGSAVASLDVTSIDQNFAHLLVVSYARTTSGLTADEVDAQLNGDSALNYDWVQVSNGSKTTGTGADNLANIGIACGGASTAGLFGVALALIPNYADTSNNKGMISLGGSMSTSTSTVTSWQTVTTFSKWRSSAAISRITLFNGGGANLDVGSRFTIYGLG